MRNSQPAIAIATAIKEFAFIHVRRTDDPKNKAARRSIFAGRLWCGPGRLGKFSGTQSIPQLDGVATELAA
jgi:hypothetical protein